MSYLEESISIISHLPVEFQRCLELIRDLDKKVQNLQGELNQLSSKYFDSLQKQGTVVSDDKELLGKIESTYTEIHSLSAEKVAIAKQLKEMLKPCAAKIGRDLEEAKKKINTEHNEESNKRKRPENFAGLDNYAFMQDDFYTPEEQSKNYCYCNRPSSGDMVACDNENCKREWFHFECVEITSQPTGDWYCRDCIQIMKKGN